MAIVLENNKYHLTIDSKTIIGVMGRKYDLFLSSLDSDDIFYLDKRFSVSNKKVSNIFNVNDEVLNIIQEFNLEQEFLDKKINELSHSEQKLLKYIMLIISNKKINIIDEPFLDLDYGHKKKIILLIQSLIREKKTVIIGSMDSNTIYTLCKYVLFINDKDCYYGGVNSFYDKKILNKYHIVMPDIVKFTTLAKDKKINLKYSYDIRDLIKDVYRNVS